MVRQSERLAKISDRARYLLRPPFAHNAVQALGGGRVRVAFKAPWRHGVAHADMDTDKFLARLCALVPPPERRRRGGRRPRGCACVRRTFGRP